MIQELQIEIFYLLASLMTANNGMQKLIEKIKEEVGIDTFKESLNKADLSPDELHSILEFMDICDKKEVSFKRMIKYMNMLNHLSNN